ncbi:MAG TPA: fumarylacetoacetate hydrolase family protein [Pyrinomonadaceae bacterium]|jgi:2-keto-4-pentenoate hydratase/2-oxohepta-3-ene-1,7-dioic acid hydratase in catechol pathway|nr:fumarylacetoacetate hydrolase family protein [Pyrinomonadaceae bacterium]
MRLCRFTHPSFPAPRYGWLEGDSVRPADESRLFGGDSAARADAQTLPLAEVRLIAPVAPTKIVCVGRNYREHAAELGNEMPAEPLLFLKAPSALTGHEDAIVLPPYSERVEHEGELAVVIGRRAREIGDAENPLDYVFGYTCLNDVTARDLQKKDKQFTRAKSFDTFCPAGPYVVTDIDPLDLRVETRVNGEVRQRGRTSEMAFAVPFLVRYVSRMMTLEPGDVISTGTPAGVGPLLDGDTVEVEVEGVATLRNSVRAARP